MGYRTHKKQPKTSRYLKVIAEKEAEMGTCLHHRQLPLCRRLISVHLVLDHTRSVPEIVQSK